MSTLFSTFTQSWGGKENGFGLAECCQDLPISSYPSSATTLHFEFYDETSGKEVSGALVAVVSSGSSTGGGGGSSSSSSGSSLATVTSPVSASKAKLATTSNIIHIDNVDQLRERSLAQIMEELV